MLRKAVVYTLAIIGAVTLIKGCGCDQYAKKMYHSKARIVVQDRVKNMVEDYLAEPDTTSELENSIEDAP